MQRLQDGDTSGHNDVSSLSAHEVTPSVDGEAEEIPDDVAIEQSVASKWGLKELMHGL